jgi:DNA-directed RNA polymerase subunit RPC12/RpoP
MSDSCATCGQSAVSAASIRHWINGIEGLRCPECNTKMNLYREASETKETMKVIYMAHPVSGDVPGNIERAKRWVRYLEEQFPVAVVASWITECEIWDDDNPEHRAAGLARDLAVLSRCEELWLVGLRISTGMAMERDHAIKKGLSVRDLTGEGSVEPPELISIFTDD